MSEEKCCANCINYEDMNFNRIILMPCLEKYSTWDYEGYCTLGKIAVWRKYTGGFKCEGYTKIHYDK